MAWTTPATWIAGTVLTAAQLNAGLRDELLETFVAKVTTAGDMAYATGSHALSRLAIGVAGEVMRTNSGATAPGWTGIAQVTSTTANQWSVLYDSSNKLVTNVSSAGVVTYTASGASARHTFANAVTVSTGGATITGVSSVTSTTANQWTVAYDSSNKVVTSVSSAGGVSYTASGSGASHNFANIVTASATSGQALSAYGVYVTVTSGTTASTSSAILGTVLGVQTTAARASGQGPQIEFTNQASAAYGGNNFGRLGVIEAVDATGSGNLNASMNFYISRSSDNKLLNALALNAASATIGVSLVLGSIPGFAASDKYLIVDASGNVHKSALGPAS